jgi:hypothetical protein
VDAFARSGAGLCFDLLLGYQRCAPGTPQTRPAVKTTSGY